MSDAVGLVRLTKQLKLRRFVGESLVVLMTSAPPVRSAPWQVARAQPVVWRPPAGLLRSMVPKRIGSISWRNTSTLKLSTDGQVLPPPAPPPGAEFLAAVIQVRISIPCVASTSADMPLP